MNQMTQYFLNREEVFPPALEHIKKRFKEDEEAFLSGKKLFPSQPTNQPDFIKLWNAFVYFRLYTDERVIDKLKEEFGDYPNLLKWFIPLHALENQFRVINETGILIDKVAIYFLLQDYLLVKSLIEIQKVMSQEAFSSMSFLHDALITGFKRFRDRVKYRNENPFAKEKESENAYKSFFNGVNIEEISIPMLDMYIKLLKGNLDFLLREIFRCFYNRDNSLKKFDFYRALYGFFKLIMPDSNMFPTENEFINNYKYYSKSYKSFQAMQVIKIYDKTKVK